MKEKQGISLIVLVITVIVMVILAGAIVLTLNNSGIIDKATDAVEQTNLATVKELTQMAWAEAYADGERTDEALKLAVNNALKQNKITEDMYKGYIINVTTSGVEFIYSDPRLNHSGIIPEGGEYITGVVFTSPNKNEWDYSNATIYKAGDDFPQNVKNGDVYFYGDYQYRYNYKWSFDSFSPEINEKQNGWGLAAIDRTKNTYGEILESVNNKQVNCLSGTFAGSDIEEAPKIPDTIIYMQATFFNCANLIATPVIPESVKEMHHTFLGCSALNVAPFLPKNVIDISGIFALCTSLVSYAGSEDPNSFSKYIIPESVTNMNNAFEGCEKVTGTFLIKSNSINLETRAFDGTVLPIVLMGTGNNNQILESLVENSNNENITVK